MTNDQMREAIAARDAWMAEIKALGHPAPSIAERASFVDGFTRGRTAGMEQAAGICDENGWRYCADAIRAEIKGAGHEG